VRSRTGACCYYAPAQGQTGLRATNGRARHWRACRLGLLLYQARRRKTARACGASSRAGLELPDSSRTSPRRRLPDTSSAEMTIVGGTEEGAGRDPTPSTKRCAHRGAMIAARRLAVPASHFVSASTTPGPKPRGGMVGPSRSRRAEQTARAACPRCRLQGRPRAAQVCAPP